MLDPAIVFFMLHILSNYPILLTHPFDNPRTTIFTYLLTDINIPPIQANL